jgi:aminomethyltransferase
MTKPSVRQPCGGGDPASDALAVRFGAGLAEPTWLSRTSFAGPRAETLVERLFTCEPSALVPGMARRTLWLSDFGAVRGLGALVRSEADGFLLISECEDREWFSQAGALFETPVREIASGGVLELVGPFAGKILAAAGFDPASAFSSYRKCLWQGAEVAVSRIGIGYEIWCKPKTASAIKEHLLAAGKAYALRIIGRAALEILELECGRMRPGGDFTPARDGFASAPAVSALGLDALAIGKSFNGRAGYLAAAAPKRPAGILFDDEIPVPHTPLTMAGRPVGATLGSLYSPAMQGAIALAVVDVAVVPGTRLAAGGFGCRSCALPLLPLD